MKIKYLIIIGLVLFIAIDIFCYYKYFKKDGIADEELICDNITSFYISYSNGYAMNAYTTYELNNNYIAKIKPYLVDPDDTLEIKVEKDVMEKVVNILKKYKVGKWDGFHKTNKNVLDGDSFSLSVKMINGKEISASGYMEWPDNYKNVVNEISKVFMEIYDNEKK